MEKFLFIDGEEICSYDDGEITRRSSKFIEKYKRTALETERAKSWKHSGEGAQFRGDVRGRDGTEFESSVNGVYPLSDTEAAYSFTISQTSGVYRTVLNDDKAPETHVVNSLDCAFSGGCADANSNTLACSVSRSYFNSDIAILDLVSGDYKTVTDGDTLDIDPFISPADGNVIYFASRGAGRDEKGSFVKYSNSAIYKLDLSRMTTDEIAASDRLNYLKPVIHGGKLYAITTPAKEKKPNIFFEILLVPVRILQAIANFISVFIRAFTGKSATSGGNNPAKGREYDSRKQFVKGNLINAEKEEKKNAKKDKNDYGFIPISWQLIEVESGTVIKTGVADYDILDDGTIIATNGKRIFAIKDGKCKKLCNTERCLCVAARHRSAKKPDPFEM